ncbi:MAG TPA: hypothetical protein VKC54_02550 [Patescibacteria group bacterium]|nr:hypothetical protein [Patescibacteria group bacterium]
MKHELEQIIVTDPRELGRQVVEKIDLDIDAVVPVVMIEPEENIRLGSFYASFVDEGDALYMQLENFDSPEWAEAFLNMYEANWETFPGGIYRVKLTNK